jgi:signal transduction histidine kinase
MVAMIHSEAFSLDFQLKNIFAAAKIEAGEIYPEIGKVDIENLVRTVSESFRLEALKKKLKLDIALNHEDEKIRSFRTDPEKLKLILTNLINNAIKFSFEESVITINVRISDSKLVISVLNRGIEISEGYKQFIFDRFKRADADITSINRGHGLGLSIIRSLLELLGGEISFKSDNVNGTKFLISVPESDEKEDSFTASLNGDELFFGDNQVF